MITKDNQDLPILQITPENYVVPAGEELYYHAKMEIKSFDQHTGERLSHPFIQKFAAIDFEEGMMHTLRQQGYDIVILHDPKEWKQKKAEEKAQKLAEKAAEAKAEAEAEAEAYKEKLKAEIRQELMAEVQAQVEAEKKGNKRSNKKAADPEAPAEAQVEAPADPSELEPDLS